MAFVIYGVTLAGLYALVAVGIVVVYSAIRVFQMAHGALVMLSAYTFLYGYLETNSVPLAVAAAIAVSIVGSLLLSLVVFEPLQGRHFAAIIAAFGISLAIEELAAIHFFNGQPVSYPRDLAIGGVTDIFGASVANSRLAILLASVIFIAATDQFLRRSSAGLRMRAVAETPVGASLSGVKTLPVIRLSFLVAGITGGIAGILLGLAQSQITAMIGASILVKSVAVVLLGGATSLRGAAVAALILGLSESLTAGYISTSLSLVVPYVVIIGVLLIRPQGLSSAGTAAV